MKNKILPRLLLLLFCLVLLRPLSVRAITPLEPDREASLTLIYQKEGAAFADLSIGIYRIAEALPDGSFELLEPFSSYPVNIHDISTQERWSNETQSVYSCIVAKQVQPDKDLKTDATGTVCFSGLKAGLYFVREVTAENDSGTYIFNRFMVYVPTPQADGSYDYEVEARPKCTEFVPKTHYTVNKLWQDAGNQAARPLSVTVDIYKDGALVDSQILSAENNWSYSWTVSGDDTGVWTVAERNVPQGYRFSLQQNGGVFSIINTSQTQPGTPPQTGDSFSPLPWVIALCLSGILLLALGIYSRRRR